MDFGIPGTFQEFRHRCLHESQDRNNAWNAEFGGFDMPRWNYCHETNMLHFSGQDSTTVACDVFIAGTALNGRWQWSWSNPNFDPHNRNLCRAVYEYGIATGWSELTTAFQDADEFTGWENVAMTRHLTSGQAVYRFPYGNADDCIAYLVITGTRKVSR